MGMEVVIAAIAVAIVFVLWAIRKDMTLDQNKDGKVDAADAKIIADKVVEEAKVVAEKVEEKVEEVAKAVKKSTTKKAPVKKAPAKKETAPKVAAAPKKKKVTPAKKKVAPKK